MPVAKLKNFLKENNIKYESITHLPASTAQETAARAHISGKNMAKTVMVKVKGELAMAILPANKKVNFILLKDSIGNHDIELASEIEFRNAFPDCELGAMPPFGNLYGMKIFVDKSLTKDKEIAFNAGTHNELIKMTYKDFEKITKPKIVTFSS